MKHKRSLTLAVFLFLLSTDLLETFVQFCFKKAALTQQFAMIASVSDAAGFAGAVLISPFLWAGLIAVFLIFIIWITILSKVDLSVAVPVASFSYVAIPLVSVIFLGERIPFLRWVGIAFILCGVIFVSLSSYRQEGVR